jgi:amino acid adenylation domain-containing protein
MAQADSTSENIHMQTTVNRLMDWDDWHREYELTPSLQSRLRLVRAQTAAALLEFPSGPVRVISLCAGDGRDLIGALQNHPRREDVSAWLLDNHVDSVNRGRSFAAEAGLETQVQFLEADARSGASYAGVAPADLVILSGFLGHLPHEDVPRLIGSLPILCNTGGSVIWNRHLVLHGGARQVPLIRNSLRQAGFEEIEFAITANDGFAVGRCCFAGQTQSLDTNRVFFTFSGQDRSRRPEEAKNDGVFSTIEQTLVSSEVPELFNVEQSIPSRFEETVALCSARQAIGSGDWQPTYAELDSTANRVAHTLLKASPGIGERVALLLRHDAPLVAAMLGILKAGKIVVVLNATEPPNRLKQLLDDAQPLAIIADSANQSLAKQIARPSVCILSIEETRKGVDESPKIGIDPNATAFLVYTSGSTGRPKGVIQTHRNILHNVLRHTRGMELCRQDRLVLLGSPSGGQGMAMTWTALLNGAALCPYAAAEKGIAALSKWLMKHQITIFVASVSLLRSFVRTLNKRDRFPAVRLVRFASESASAEDVTACRAHFADDCVILNTFSSSETGNITQYRLPPGRQPAAGRLSIGAPVPGLAVSLWDDNGNEINHGEVGEVIVKSRFISPGYWLDDELTAQRFSRQNGFTTFRTGDLARRTPDGGLLFMGRKDDRIKINGYRVELRAIEDALIHNSQIEDAVVCVREGHYGSPQLVAYAVKRANQACTVETLRHALRSVLPGYMVPARFIFLKEFPLTPTGKVDKQALPLPEKALLSRGERPREAVEKSLTSIWQSVLGVAPIGRHDDFFDLGGTSLQIVEVLLHIEEKLGTVLPPSALAERSTIAKLAPMLAEAVVIRSPGSLVVLRNEKSGRPLFLLHTGQGDVTTYGPLARRLPGRPIYGLQSVGLQGECWPLRTVPGMARRYLAEILEKDPTGPYLIGGTCMGGIVAFELAHLLIEQGRKV